MSQEPIHSHSQEATTIIANLEKLRKNEVSSVQSFSSKRKIIQVFFNFSVVAFTLWLILWTIGIIGLNTSLEKFMLLKGSMVLGFLFLLSLVALLLLMKIPKNIITKKSSLAKEFRQQYIPYYTEEVYLGKTALSYSFGEEQNLRKNLKLSRLIKLQENILDIGAISLFFEDAYFPATISNIHIQKQVGNNKPSTTLKGIFVAITLPELIKNNVLFFPISNNLQHFESVSFNDIIIGDNEVRRLIKQHNAKVPHTLVDEFNKYVLMLGRNPSWLVNEINEECVNTLLSINNQHKQNIRIEIDAKHIYAFLPNSTFLKGPNPKEQWDESKLNAYTQQEINYLQDLIQQLKKIAVSLYSIDIN